MLLFIFKIKIKKDIIFYKPSYYDFNFIFYNNLLLFLKILFYEGLFIYGFNYFYNFLKKIYNKKKTYLNSIILFLKNKDFLLNIIFLRVFKFLFFIPFKVFVINLEITEIFYNLWFNCKMKNFILLDHFFLNITIRYFIFLKNEIKLKKIFVINNNIIFNPLKDLNNFKKAITEFIHDPNNIYVAYGNFGFKSTKQFFHFGLQTLCGDKSLIIGETTKTPLTVLKPKNETLFFKNLEMKNNLNNEKNINENFEAFKINLFKSKKGSLISGVEETYCSPVIQADNNDLVTHDIPEFTFKGVLNNSINPTKFVNAHIYNFNNPMCVLIDGKVVKSVEHVSFDSFILHNKYNLPKTLINLHESYNEIEKYFFDTYPDASDEDRQYFINSLSFNEWVENDEMYNFYKKLIND